MSVRWRPGMLAVVSGVDKYRVIGMGSECLVVATPAGYSVVSMCRCTPDMNDELTVLAMDRDPLDQTDDDT